MIKIHHQGNLGKTDNFLKRASKILFVQQILSQYGRRGVMALTAGTPVDSGLTAASWYYTIKKTSTGYSIIWSNSNVVDGVVIAIILQYGHGTGNGAYVEGRDYINPSLRSVFDDFSNKIGEEVSRL